MKGARKRQRIELPNLEEVSAAGSHGNKKAADLYDVRRPVRRTKSRKRGRKVKPSQDSFVVNLLEKTLNPEVEAP